MRAQRQHDPLVLVEHAGRARPPSAGAGARRRRRCTACRPRPAGRSRRRPRRPPRPPRRPGSSTRTRAAERGAQRAVAVRRGLGQHVGQAAQQGPQQRVAVGRRRPLERQARRRPGAARRSRVVTLSPIPSTTAPGAGTSASSPHSLRPADEHVVGPLEPGVDARSARAPPAPRRRRPTAAATASARRAASGRSSTDRVRPARGGETQVRSSRPRPAVCCSATTTSPAGSPSRARSATTALVEPGLRQHLDPPPVRLERPGQRAGAQGRAVEVAVRGGHPVSLPRVGRAAR